MARSNGLAERKSIAVCSDRITLCAFEYRKETLHGVCSHKQQLQGRRLFAEGFHPVCRFRLRLRRRQHVAASEMVGCSRRHEEFRGDLLRSIYADRIRLLALA